MGYVTDKHSLRGFLFRHLHLITAVEQNIVILRYGPITIGEGMEWSQIAYFAEVPRSAVRSIHDEALRKISKGTKEPEVPFLQWANRRKYEALKLRARAKVAAALKAGTLIRQPCERCGEEKSDAHHPNYTKMLEVLWLCRSCHMAEHSRLSKVARGIPLNEQSQAA